MLSFKIDFLAFACSLGGDFFIILLLLDCSDFVDLFSVLFVGCCLPSVVESKFENVFDVFCFSFVDNRFSEWE